MNGVDLVHAAHVHTDATERGIHMAFKRGARSERDHRHDMRGTQRHNLRNLFGGVWPHDNIGSLCFEITTGMTMLGPDRFPCCSPVAKSREKCGNNGVDGFSGRAGTKQRGSRHQEKTFSLWLIFLCLSAYRGTDCPLHAAGARAIRHKTEFGTR